MIEGPKWCGKIWTAENHSKSKIMLADPAGNFSNKELALMRPDFVLRGKTPRLMDEWQVVPPVWDAIRGNIDAHPQNGKFILTGSTTVDKSEYIHSGTGRISHLRMRTMSLYESGYSSGTISLQDICNNKAPDCFAGDVNLDSILDYILVGGFPSTIGYSTRKGCLVAKEYVNSVLNEDIYKIDKVKRDSHKMELLLKSLARNEATTASNEALRSDIKAIGLDEVSSTTVTEYLDVLKRLYLIEKHTSVFFSPSFFYESKASREKTFCRSFASLCIAEFDKRQTAWWHGTSWLSI